MKIYFAIALMFFFLGAMFERFIVSVNGSSPARSKIFFLGDRAEKEIVEVNSKSPQKAVTNRLSTNENNYAIALENANNFYRMIDEEVLKNFKSTPYIAGRKFPYPRIENKFRTWSLNDSGKSRWFKTTFSFNVGFNLEFIFFFEANYCGDKAHNKKNNSTFGITQCVEIYGGAKYRDKWFATSSGGTMYSFLYKNENAYYDIMTTHQLDFFQSTGLARIMLPIPGEQAQSEALIVKNNQLQWDEGDDIDYVQSSKKEMEEFFVRIHKDEENN